MKKLAFFWEFQPVIMEVRNWTLKQDMHWSAQSQWSEKEMFYQTQPLTNDSFPCFKEQIVILHIKVFPVWNASVKGTFLGITPILADLESLLKGTFPGTLVNS